MVYQIAKACHEVNRVFCRYLGDDSQVAFEDAPEWQRESAMAGVQGVLDGKIVTPEAQHEAWCAQKVADGWVCGETKDAKQKTHPCLVPYHELPAEQQMKDHLFRAVATAFLPK